MRSIRSALDSIPVYADPSNSQTIAQTSGSLTVAGSFNAMRIDGVRYASQFPGADMGEKINNAVIDLGGSGGRIIIPPGVYPVAEANRIVFDGDAGQPQSAQKGIIIEGSSSLTDGTSATILQWDGGTHPLIAATSTYGFTLKNVAVEQTGSSNDTLVDLNGAVYVTIEDCNLSGPANRLLSIDRTVGATIRHVRLINAEVGVEGAQDAGSFANSVQITNSRFGNLGQVGIRTAVGENWTISDNTFERLADLSAGALDADDSYLQGLVYSDNYHGDANTLGTWVRVKANGAVIAGNMFATGDTGVALADQSIAVSIQGNSFPPGPATAVDLGPYSYGVSMTGNFFGTTTPVQNLYRGHPNLHIIGNYAYGKHTANVEGHVIVDGYGPDGGVPASMLAVGAGGATPNAASIMWGDNTGWKLNFGTTVSSTFTPRVTMVDNGTVGIGTQAPTAALEVNGGVRVNTSSTRPSCTSDQRGTLWVSQDSRGDQVFVCVLSGGALGWHQVSLL